MIVACCQIEVSATGPSFAKRSPTEYVVSSECDFATSTLRRPRPTRAVEPWRGGGIFDMFNVQNSLKRKDSLLSLLLKFDL